MTGRRLIERDYVETQFASLPKKYPMSVESADGSLLVARYSRDCPPGQVNFLCTIGGRQRQVGAEFGMDLPRFCEVIRVRSSDIAKLISLDASSLQDENALQIFLRIAPAFNELNRLFKGARSGKTLKSFETILTDESGEMTAISRLLQR